MMGQYPGILQIQIERRTVGIIVADVFAREELQAEIEGAKDPPIK